MKYQQNVNSNELNCGSSYSRRKEERPAEILSAALTEFSVNGFAGTRLEDVARRAGICKGTIYLYFHSKQDLFEAVVRDRILPYLEQLEQIGTRIDGSASEILRQQLELIYRELVATDTRFIPKLMIGEGNRFPELAEFYFREVITRMHKLLRTVIERGVASGEFRREALDWKPQAILSPALSAAMWRVVFDQFDKLNIDAFLQTHIDLLLNGLKTSA